MNILYIDNDEDFQKEFEASLGNISDIKLLTANSKEKVIEQIETSFVDIYILGLFDSHDEEAKDIYIKQGIEVLDSIQQRAPLTPVYIITNLHLNNKIVNKLLSTSHHLDIWCEGKSTQTIKILPKKINDQLLKEIEHQTYVLTSINKIPIDSSGHNLLLKPEQKRLIQLFTRQFNGSSCRVKSLDDGLSDSRVLHLKVESMGGATRIHAVGKLDDIKRIDKEVNNFQQEVSRLPLGAYAPQVHVIKGGAKLSGGVFYRLVTPNDRTLFQLLIDDPGEASITVNKLKKLMGTWQDGIQRNRVQIKDIRKCMVSDEDLNDIINNQSLGWIHDLESKEIYSRSSCIHADLHGGNVFVSTNNEPVMIDFMDVKVGPAVLDPITLELSIFTHPSMKENIKWLPDCENPNWSVIDLYVANCPYESYIRACREWSHDVAGGDIAVNAGAYVYLLRQLKYPDVDHELVLSLLNSIKNSIMNTV